MKVIKLSSLVNVTHIECYECGRTSDTLAEVASEHFDVGGAWICKCCLEKALELLKE